MESLGREMSDLVLSGAGAEKDAAESAPPLVDPPAAPRKRGILDVLDVVCARGYLRAATRLCVASKAVAAVAPMGTGKQVYEAAKAGRDEELTTYLEYWRDHADSPEVLNWAPIPLGGIKVKPAKEGQPVHAQFQDSPLVAAVMHDRLACVQLLVASAPFVDVNKGRYAAPLHYASRLGRTAMVHTLLAAQGIDVNKSSDTDRTPLHWAAELGHTEVARALLGARGIKTNTPDATGRMPLHWAAEKGHVDVGRLLVAVRGIQLEKDAHETPNTLAWVSQDPLVLAEREGHWDVVRVLTEAIEKAHILDEAGYQIYDAADEGDVARLRPLLQRWGGNAEVVKWDDGHGMRGTPLLTASREGHVEVVRLLASTAAVDVNRPNFQNWSPLMKAAFGGHVDVARLLLSLEGIDLNMRATFGHGEGMTALSLVKERREMYGQGEAVWRRQEEIAVMLRAAGAQE